ncbi:MAG: FeoA family protein [Syntrophomonadaceae bacterium]|nr:FeoA family protein [Syntrophomonadaceae bacterium]MDD3888431.1 FeoA family protein [Syntrophomonadaceae bacterium]MDD4549183.1 FeoA family protein [Syntrophomonadaceae bacterium]
MTINDMYPGQKGNVETIMKGSSALRRLFELGIVPGAQIQVINRHPFHGPVIVQIGNSRIAIGRNIASTVKVRLEEDK